MINAGMLLASCRRLTVSGPAIALGLTGMSFFRYQVRANETYSEAKRQFSDGNRDVLPNTCAWEQQDWNKTIKDKGEEGKKKGR